MLLNKEYTHTTNVWEIVYERAERRDGTLLFPERLNRLFLDNARRVQGSYIYSNQYLNEVIPEDEKTFKPHWLKYYKKLPSLTYRFGFIDPAIGQDRHHDYTGICIVDVDPDGVWYLRVAKRERLNPTQIVDKMFEICKEFQLKALGVEVVAYQEALLYILQEKMNEKKIVLPVKGVTRARISKQTRIFGLVPRFEWGRLLVSQGMVDFEDEYNTFPRGNHDDILDALASIEEIAFYPIHKEIEIVEPHSPHDPDYERWLIREKVKQQQSETAYIDETG